MVNWKEWSEGWLKEGFYLSYTLNGVTYYERVLMRDWARYVYDLPSVDADGTSDENIPADIEITRGYNPATALNYLWQVIFGIMGEVYIYVQLPADVKRHGTAMKPWHSREKRDVAHYEEWMSPFHEPTFITEHFLKRPETNRISFDIYNPQNITVTPKLNFLIAKLVTERVGTESYTEAGLELKPTQPKWEEILRKLYQRVIPCRPITLLPIRMPAVGE